jgi:hypothetical protein
VAVAVCDIVSTLGSISRCPVITEAAPYGIGLGFAL